MEVRVRSDEAGDAEPDERDRPSSSRDIWRAYYLAAAESHARMAADYERRAAELDDEGG